MHDFDDIVRTSGPGDTPGGADRDAQLRVDGIEAPIHTRVTRRGRHGMTVEQPLPFLQLQTLVEDQAARRSRIESVSMVVYDGMPRLVLDLAYEADGADAGEGATTAAIEQAALLQAAAGQDDGGTKRAPGVMRPRPESQATGDTPGLAGAQVGAQLGEQVSQQVAGVDQTQSFERPSGSPPLVSATATGSLQPVAAERRESTLVFDTVPPPPGQPAIGDDDAHAIERMHADRLGPRLQRAWSVAQPRLQRAAVVTASLCVRAAKWTAPRLRDLAARLRQLVARRMARRAD